MFSNTSWLVKLNYGIAVAVVLLGVLASYVTMQPGDSPPEDQLLAVEQKAPVAGASGQAKPGEWVYSCALSLDGMEDCRAQQRILWPQSQDFALEVAFSSVKRDHRSVIRLQLRAPLGAFLPAGFSLGLEGQEVLIVPYQACEDAGCFVNLDMASDVEAAIRREGMMVVEYMTSEQKIATVKIPLQGINDVLARL